MDAPPPPPGWYPDPHDRRGQRYWNGDEWTEYDRATPQWQPFPPGSLPVRNRLPWWQWWAVVVPSLLLCLPLGLAGLWSRPGVPARGRLIGTAAAGVVLLLVLAANAGTPDSSTPAADSAPTSASTPSESAPTPASPSIELVSTPRVRGATSVAARQALRQAGLVVGDVVRRPSAQPAGTVLSQEPSAGAPLSPGTTVDLVVASPLPRVPSLVGLGSAAAQRRLRQAGFRVVLQTRTISSGSDHSVLEERPSGGTPVHPGATVTLVVAHVHAPALVQTSCTPGYSPCLPPASDYDCAGGSGNGPKYVDQTETVTGSDPYELDSDGDGYGCE